MSSARWLQNCSANRDLYLKMAELQEDTEALQLNQEKIQCQIITDLEMKITELSTDNQEMKKCLSDLSQQNFELKTLFWSFVTSYNTGKEICCPR